MSAHSLSASQSNQQFARELCSVFADVPTSNQPSLDFKCVGQDRSMAHYSEAIAWASLILENETPLTGIRKSRAPSLLFPMEAVFKAFITKNLVKQLVKPLIMKTLLRSLPLVKHRDQSWFQLKPDMLVREAVHDRLVLDTKWKLIDEGSTNGTKKYGLS